MDCPRCRSSSHVKDGIIRGNQRYRCKGCHYRYSVERKSDVKTPEIRRMALIMNLEGIGFRRIGRILKISYGTVYAWVKQWSARVFFPRRESPVESVTPEQLLDYIASQKATGRYGLLLIDLDNGHSLLSVDSAPRQKGLKRKQKQSIIV